MVRISIAESCALISGYVVDRLARIVSDVDDPVGQTRELLGDARAVSQIPSARLHLLVSLHGRGHGLVLITLAALVTATAASHHEGDEEGE